MACISCGASLITGPGADEPSHWQIAVAHAAPSFHGQDSARFSYSSQNHSQNNSKVLSGGIKPRIRDTFAFDRRLAGARPGIDLCGGRRLDTGVGLLPVQTYGG
jgi:hypothetical protein